MNVMFFLSKLQNKSANHVPFDLRLRYWLAEHLLLWMEKLKYLSGKQINCRMREDRMIYSVYCRLTSPNKCIISVICVFDNARSANAGATPGLSSELCLF